MAKQETIDLVKKLYPDCQKEGETYFNDASDYTPIIESLGTVLYREDDDDWQGDTRVLLQKDNQYAYMCFGWGSCSGCDALQGCNSYEDIAEVYENLCTLKWMSAEELLNFFRTHDWEGDYNHSETFNQKCDEILSTLISQKTSNPTREG